MQREIGRDVADLVLRILRVVSAEEGPGALGRRSPWMYLTQGAPGSSARIVTLGLRVFRVNDVVSP